MSIEIRNIRRITNQGWFWRRSLCKWWRLVDQQTAIAIFLLFGIGLILVATASRCIAHRTGLKGSYFIVRQLIYLGAASGIIVTFSLLRIKIIKRIAILGFVCSFILLILVKFHGHEIKGAKRWISIFGFSIQPSEFIKPCFLVVNGWILSLRNENFPSFTLSFVLYISIALLVMCQPDIGVLALISTSWGVQIFIAEIHIALVLSFVFCVGILMSVAYIVFPHVTQRIDSFLYTNQGYQVSKSLEAFKSGGFWGKGPGEGTVKDILPDAYTDFIFSVAGEEFGVLSCLLINLIFAFIVIRGLIRALDHDDKFTLLASVGLLAQFGIQAIVNMGVALNLLPTKGMTLPFISYGGSSILALSVNIGMLLALTKRSLQLNKYKIKVE